MIYWLLLCQLALSMEIATLRDMDRTLYWRTLFLVALLILPGLLIYFLVHPHYWLLLVYGVLAVAVLVYPLFRHNVNPTFFYWDLFIRKAYSKIVLPVKYSVSSLIISTLFVTGVFWYLIQPKEQEWLIVITAFYASILLFREVFFDFSILRLGIMHQMYSPHGDTLSIETRIGNVGTKTVTDPHLEYRIYDKRGIPVSEKKKAEIPGESRSLNPGEWTKEDSISLTIDLSQFPEDIGTFYLHTVAYSGFGYSLLSDNLFRKCTMDDENSVTIEE